MATEAAARVLDAIRNLGGIASTRRLVAAGVGEKTLQRAARAGVVDRICPGWYALPTADQRLVRAIRSGGSLGCVSGAAVHGLWEPPGAGMHLSVPHGSNVPRFPPGPDRDVTHWGNPARREDTCGLLPLPECLAQVLACMPADYAFAVLESALRTRRLGARELRTLRAASPRAKAQLIDEAGDLADSGSESLFRYRMLRLGIVMRSQVSVPGVGRVDFLIGDRLIVEVDSEAFHGTPEQRRRDLNRDAIAVGLGFVVLHFDYAQIIYDWHTVESTVLAVIARREHSTRG